MIEWLQSAGGEAVLDTRHQPVVISSFRGAPDAQLIDGFFAWSDSMAAAAMAAEQQLVLVTDLSEARIPTPAVRKRLVEHNSVNPMAEVSLAHITVVPSLRLRSVVRTIARLSQPYGRSEILFVANLEEGIELGLRLLWRARIPPPPGLHPREYRSPQRALS